MLMRITRQDEVAREFPGRVPRDGGTRLNYIRAAVVDKGGMKAAQ